MNYWIPLQGNAWRGGGISFCFAPDVYKRQEWYIVQLATNTKDISLRMPAENTFEGFSIEVTKEQTTDLTPCDYRVIKKIGDKDVAAYFSFTKYIFQNGYKRTPYPNLNRSRKKRP